MEACLIEPVLWLVHSRLMHHETAFYTVLYDALQKDPLQFTLLPVNPRNLLTPFKQLEYK